jgi:hypothetical protein
LLAEGVEHATAASGPFDQALLHDALGRLLRRQGERRKGFDHLTEALDTYGRLGAAPFHERCATEIAACGLHPRRASPAASRQPRLTAREQGSPAL